MTERKIFNTEFKTRVEFERTTNSEHPFPRYANLMKGLVITHY